MEQIIHFAHTVGSSHYVIELAKIYQDNNRLIVLLKMSVHNGNAACAFVHFMLNLRLQINSEQQLPISFFMLSHNPNYQAPNVNSITDEAELGLSPYAVNLYDGGFCLPRRAGRSDVVITNGIAYDEVTGEMLPLMNPNQPTQVAAVIRHLNNYFYLNNNLRDILHENDSVKRRLNGISIKDIIKPLPSEDSHVIRSAQAEQTLAVIRLLVEAGFNMNDCEEKTGRSLIMDAVEHGYHDIVRSFFDQDAADAFIIHKAGCHKALNTAIDKGHSGVVRELLFGGHGLDYDAPHAYRYNHKRLNCSLFLVKNVPFIEIATMLLTADSAIYEHAIPGATDLMIATVSNNTIVISRLLEDKVDVNQQNTDGETALMMAVERGFVEIVKQLLGAKARIDIKDKYDITARDLALDQDNKQIKQLFLGQKITSLPSNVKSSQHEFTVMDITNPNAKVRYNFFDKGKHPLLQVETLDTDGQVKPDSKRRMRANCILISVDEQQDTQQIANRLNERLSRAMGMTMALQIEKLIWKNKKWQCKIEFPLGSGFFSPLFKEASKMGLSPVYDEPDEVDRSDAPYAFRL